MQNKIEFTSEANKIIDLVQKSRDNLFITGKAGTGKSTLLSYIYEQDKSIIVLAPTGIAAINVNGDTIHSFFKLKPDYELDEAKHVRINNRMRERYAEVHTVIIDEISMVRADLLDAIDIFLQRVRKDEQPFGGVRMIFFGDLYQLPPVLTTEDEAKFQREYKSPYFFSAHTFIQKDLFSAPFQLKKYELNTIYRQKDPEFTQVLNAIRDNTYNKTQLQRLNQQVKAFTIEDGQEFIINLVSTNAIANSINLQKLRSIDSEQVNFSSYQTGNIKNLKPNDTEIALKVGAQIMFLNNDAQKRWANGSLGKVLEIGTKIDEEVEVSYRYVSVELENGKSVEVTPYTWEISKYSFRGGRFEREAIGTFTQLPLKLAWAITIHKCQGKTFNRISIDLGNGSFAHGQTYVALSRCKTLENINLTRAILASDIIIDEEVLRYIKA